METLIKTLIVDDSPMIIEAYKSLFSNANIDHITFNIDVAENCDQAISKMKLALKNEPYELFYFDLKLPPSQDGLYQSGEDLALFAKKNFPKAKIVILTMFNESFRIQNILSKVNPDGLMIKNDSNPKEFIAGLKSIIEGKTHLSSSVVNILRDSVVRDELKSLNQDDINILKHLANGVKTVDLDQYINLSLSSIEKKKSNLKKLFNITNGKDEMLIAEAKKRGIIQT